MSEAARRADCLVAVSETIRRDLMEYFPVKEKKVKVVYNAAGEHFKPLHDREEAKNRLSGYGISSPYLLFVGSIEPVKNVAGLLRAYEKIHRDVPHHLVIIGMPGWRHEAIQSFSSEMRLDDKVHWLGYVPSEELVFFYNMADIFIYPSFYEGFGIPILEAFQCGTPVITSKAPAMSEVAGDAACLIDPHEVESISGAMLELVRNQTLREDLSRKGLERARQFSWKKAAGEMLSLFKEVAV